MHVDSVHSVRKPKDLHGQTFGQLEALRLERIGKELFWVCLCKCGTLKPVRTGHLTSGKVSSCGCTQYITTAQKLRDRYTVHGLTRTAMYSTWRSMKRRCIDKSHPNYPEYGGRGIKVCERWKRSFENFLMDMGYRPMGLSLNRINNDGDYCPENCAWSSASEQASNRRSTHWITMGDERVSMAEAARRVGMRPGTLSERLRRGMPPKEALNTPVMRHHVAI